MVFSITFLKLGSTEFLKNAYLLFKLQEMFKCKHLRNILDKMSIFSQFGTSLITVFDALKDILSIPLVSFFFEISMRT